MPESLESEAHSQLAQRMFHNLKNSGEDFHLLDIWADGTDKEQSRAPTGSRLRNGHIYKLEPDSKIKRGSRKKQTAVFPPMLAPKKTRKSRVTASPSVETLELRAIHSGSRSISLDFGKACLQVRNTYLILILRCIPSYPNFPKGSISYAYFNPDLLQITVGKLGL